MDCQVQDHGSKAVLLLKGRLDASTAKELKDIFTDQLKGGRLKLILDLSALTFIDSSGLGTIVAGLRGFSSKGGDICVAGMNDQVRTLFELTRLSRVFTSFDSVDSALAAF